jgi:hypothetical protein
MAIQRTGDKKDDTPKFQVGLNIILQKSKEMTPDEQEAAITADAVRVRITDANDKDYFLVDVILPATEFSTGSVGYKYHVKDLSFEVLAQS